MSGHKSRRNFKPRQQDLGAQAKSTAQLDQLAQAAGDIRSQPNFAALSDLEAAFLRGFDQAGAHLDQETTGAAWLIAGNLFASYLNGLSAEQRNSPAPATILTNVLRLAGQALYSDALLPVTVACPYTYSSGAPCKSEYTGSSQEQADLLMNAHIQLHHPGKPWPVEGAERAQPEPGFAPGPHAIHLVGWGPFDRLEITWAPGAEVNTQWAGLIAKAAMAIVGADEDVADAVNLAPTDPAARAAATADLEAEFPDEVISDSADPGWSSGLQDFHANVGENFRARHAAGTPNPNAKHAPHGVCDCPPGQTYHHCVTGPDGEVDGR